MVSDCEESVSEVKTLERSSLLVVVRVAPPNECMTTTFDVSSEMRGRVQPKGLSPVFSVCRTCSTRK